MSETTDPSRREELKAELQALVEELKVEISNRLDQWLDEIGARI